jgi:predicted transcriptional regulator of viral defense system
MAEKLDTRPDVRVARLAADAWGVLSLDELYACGLSDDAASDRVRSGRLHRLHRGVYAVGHASVTVEGRFLAAVKACGPRAVLSHRAAAALWGFMDWDHRHPEVTVVGSATSVHRGIRVHRTATLDRSTSSGATASRSPHRPAPSSTSPPPSATTRCAARRAERSRCNG